jgi:hypothetical protein
MADRKTGAHRNVPVVEVHVRTADRSGVDRHHHPVGAGQDGVRRLNHRDATWTIDDDVAHWTPYDE